MKTPESYEKAEIRKYLESIGAWHCIAHMGGFGFSGVPDILASIRGQFVAIEVKREGKLPTELQKRRMEEINEAGGWTFWGTSKKVIAEIEQWRPTYL